MSTKKEKENVLLGKLGKCPQTEEREHEALIKDLKQSEGMVKFFGAKNLNSCSTAIKPSCDLCVFVDARGAGVLCAGEDHV